MLMPVAGSSVHLMCKKCKHLFVGPCPSHSGRPLLSNKDVKEPVCPQCGSKKIILNPFVHY